MQQRLGKLTFQEIVDQICDEIGMMPPQNLNDKDDDLARQFRALANKTGRVLADEYNWLALKRIGKEENDRESDDFLRYTDSAKTDYVSTNWVIAADAALKALIDNTNDKTVYADEIFITGLKARFLEAKGFDAAHIYQEHEKCIANCLGKENAQRQKKNLDLGFEGSKPSGGSLHPFGL